jgi:hypothetical protein
VYGRKVEWLDHGVALAVAAGLLAGAFAGGGYGPERSATAGIIVWCVVAAVLLGRGPARLPAARAGRWLAALLVAFALLSGASAWWADDPGRAIGSATPASLYAGLATLVLVAAPRVAAIAWIRGVAIGLLLIAAAALGSRFWPEAFADALVQALPSARSRLGYPIGYWNALGFAMASGTIALGWLSCRGATRAGRVAALAVLPVPALVLYLTSSRGALAALVTGLALLLALERRRLALALGLAIGAAGALAVVAVATARPAFADGATSAIARGQAHTVLLALLAACAALALVRALTDGALARAATWRTPRLLGWAAAIAAAGTAVFVVLAVDLPGRLDAFRTPPVVPSRDGAGLVTSHLLSASGSGRYQFWAAAWDAFRAHPLRGLGTGGYEQWWTGHGSLAYPVRNAHSLGFETLAELGLPGGVLLLGLGGLLAIATVRRRHAGAAGDSVLPVAMALTTCGAVATAIDWTWQVPVALAPAALGAAVALSLPAARGASSVRPRWFAAALGSSALAVAAAGMVLVTEVQLDRSRAAVRAGDLPAAATAAAAAAAMQPWAAAPRLQLALVAERRGDLPAAVRAVSLALDRAPLDWRAWLVAARVRVKAGDLPGARAAVAQVHCLHPHANFPPVDAIASRRSIIGRKELCGARSDRHRDGPRAGRSARRLAGARDDRHGPDAVVEGLAAASDAGAGRPRRRHGGDDRVGGGRLG